MAYIPTVWKDGDLITAERMNKIEQGVENEQIGPQGEAGAAAGFGNVSATVDANTGAPSVTVTATGPDAAKNLSFAFHNLKGAKGDAGPQGQKGATGTTGPQGPKGDTGVGVPAGGTAGQVLAKSSGADYDTGWINAPQGGSGGGTGRKTARFVIGTSAAGWTANDCDYLCDGTADDVEINAAIDALPSTGGEILILDGTYNITNDISIKKSNVTFTGSGSSTILKRMWMSAEGHATSVIELWLVNNCAIKNLKIDGNRSNYSNNAHSIVISGAKYSRVINVAIVNSETAIYVVNECNSDIIAMSMITDCEFGIRVVDGRVSNLLFVENIISVQYEGITIGSAKSSTILGNVCYSCRTGITLWYETMYNTISGNSLNNNHNAIEVNKSSYNTIIGNSCIECTTSTIKLLNSSSYNLIANNNIMGMNYSCDGGASNTFVNNKYE